MRISVIIPTIARHEYLKDVLNDLSAQTVTPSEVLVVDQSRPEDIDREIYRQCAQKLSLRVILMPDARGTCVARNVAIGLAKGTHLLFLDDDVRFEPDLISKYRAIVQPCWDAVHGGVRAQEKPLFAERLCFNDPVQHLIASPNTDSARMTIGVASGNVLVDRNWVEKIQGFDRWFDTGVCDDWDFGLRLFRAGAKVLYHPEPCIRHLKAPIGGRRPYFVRPSRLIGSFAEYFPITLAPRLYFYRKHFTRRAAALLSRAKFKEIYRPEYRMLRFFWALPLATLWFLKANTMAKKMAKQGPRVMGTYSNPEVETLQLGSQVG